MKIAAALPLPHAAGASVRLRAESAADAALVARLAAVLSAGDAAVRLTTMLELLERHEAMPAPKPEAA